MTVRNALLTLYLSSCLHADLIPSPFHSDDIHATCMLLQYVTLKPKTTVLILMEGEAVCR